MTVQKRKNNLSYKLLIVLLIIIGIAVFALIGCGGGFYDDNENASEFKNPIFHPEQVEPDTIDVQ